MSFSVRPLTFIRFYSLLGRTFAPIPFVFPLPFLSATRSSAHQLPLTASPSLFTVPAQPGGLNIYLENVPAGDDHVLVILNSTYGVLQGSSQRFTILPWSGSSTNAPLAPVGSHCECDKWAEPDNDFCDDVACVALECNDDD
jgi:hypothetical protein